MNILILNGSPSGDDSITLQTLRYIELFHPEHTFSILNVALTIKKIEKDFSSAAEAIRQADLLVFCYPVYTFLVPSQLHRFIELMKDAQLDLSGKCATQVTTSKHFYDTTAHQFIQDNCDDLALPYIRGLSADMDDLLTPAGQKDALTFFDFVLWSVDHHIFKPKHYPASSSVCNSFPPVLPPDESIPKNTPGKVIIVADLAEDAKSEPLKTMIERFIAVLPVSSEVVNLRTFPFAGGCLGCFHCAMDGTCVYRDGFDEYLREHIQTGDAIIYAYTIRDHSMGSLMKLFDDRQFCNGHRTVTMGKTVGYLVAGTLSQENNLSIVMEARAQVGGNFLAGIVSNETDPASEIDRLSAVLVYALEHKFQLPKNFYSIGGLKIFRDLIYEMQGLMQEDHRFYKAHGFYNDFPQRHKGRIIGMYAVGFLMRNRTFSNKIAGKMTEGMLMPYQKVLNRTKKNCLQDRAIVIFTSFLYQDITRKTSCFIRFLPATFP